MKNLNKLVVVLVFAILILSPTASVHGQEKLSFVYGTNHFNGATYSSTMVPPSVDTFYLIANRPSIVAGRMTRVYYWPLTNELKADWGTANIVVEGSLEVLKNNQVVESVSLTNYVIQYDAVDKMGTIDLFLGEDAVAARQNYEQLKEQYRIDLYEYFDAMNEYRETFQAALAELQAGNITEEQLPEPPEPQKDLSLFSTELLIGYPLELEPGRYIVQLRLDNGDIQPNSQKEVIVFEAMQEGIGYNVITEERWSVPELSVETNEIIYSVMGKTIYLEPYYQKQYNELFYTRLNNPQDKQARRDRTVWVPFSFTKDAMLTIGNEQLTLQDYHVSQVAGSALGYQIVVHEPESTQNVTFSAYEIEVGSPNMSLHLRDEDGDVLDKSEREIRVLQTQRDWLVYSLSALPLIGGLIAFVIRWRSVTDGGGQREIYDE